MKTLLRHIGILSGDGGQTMVVVVLLAFVGLVTDGGNAYSERRRIRREPA